jgi:hypothetical protein
MLERVTGGGRRAKQPVNLGRGAHRDGADHAEWRALALADAAEQLQALRLQQQAVVLLKLRAPQLQRRQGGVTRQHLADVKHAATLWIDEHTTHIRSCTDPRDAPDGRNTRAAKFQRRTPSARPRARRSPSARCRCLVVDGHDRVVGAHLDTRPDHAVGLLLHLGIAALDGIEVEALLVLALHHTRGGAAPEADAVRRPPCPRSLRQSHNTHGIITANRFAACAQEHWAHRA